MKNKKCECFGCARSARVDDLEEYEGELWCEACMRKILSRSLCGPARATLILISAFAAVFAVVGSVGWASKALLSVPDDVPAIKVGFVVILSAGLLLGMGFLGYFLWKNRD